MVSLSELVRRATPYESREAAFDRWLRIGAWSFLGVVTLYLLMTFLAMANVDPEGARSHFFIVGWSFFVSVILLGSQHQRRENRSDRRMPTFPGGIRMNELALLRPCRPRPRRPHRRVPPRSDDQDDDGEDPEGQVHSPSSR